MKLPHIPRSARPVILVALVAIALAAAAAYQLLRPEEETQVTVYIEDEVHQGDIEVGVTESGSLSYGVTTILYELDLTTDEDDDDDDDDDDDEEVPYLKVGVRYVSIGERIHSGDKLLSFTEESIARAKRKLSAAIRDAQTALQEAQNDYTMGELTAAQKRDMSKTEAEAAELIYTSSVTSLQNQVNILQAKIDARQADIKKVNDDFEDASDAMGEKASAYSNWVYKLEDEDLTDNVKGQISYLDAKHSYEEAQDKIESMKEQIADDNEDIAEYQKDIAEALEILELDMLKLSQERESAVTEGKLADAVYSSDMQKYAQTVEDAKSDLKELQEKLQALEDFVGDGVLIAKEEGIITEASLEEGDYLEEEGTTVLSYATPGEMTVSVDVSEEDIIALSIGDPVSVYFKAYPDEEYKGHIKSMETTRSESYATTVSYPVTVAIEGDTSKLYGGMSADLTFVTESAKDVVYISRSAVVSENEKGFVYVDGKNGEKELKEIKTGLSNGIYVVVEEGLAQGDVIYIASIVNKDAAEENTEETDTKEHGDEADAGTGANSGNNDAAGDSAPGGNGTFGGNGTDHGNSADSGNERPGPGGSDGGGRSGGGSGKERPDAGASSGERPVGGFPQE